jgi:cell wall assembly regulator SMI1
MSAVDHDVQSAALAIRHVVQEHGDAFTRIGKPAQLDQVEWFGHVLGWTWPASYVDVLTRHDGVTVLDAIVFSFLESISVMLIFRERWHHPTGYWPVGSDGCGNYYTLALGERRGDGECPVVFFEMIESDTEPAYVVAPSYAEYVIQRMRDQCRLAHCPDIPQGEWITLD